MINDYDKIFLEYNLTNVKPDKLYSMLPTMLKLLKPFEGKTVIDVGCGNGFFTFAMAKDSKVVYGIDSSNKQIEYAKKFRMKKTNFSLSDMANYDYPKSDRIHASFVLGYLESKKQLFNLFKKFFDSLHKGGKVAGIIDSPNSKLHDNKRFGSIKTLRSLNEGEKLTIELYNSNVKITTLKAFYHTQETIEKELEKVGFKNVTWHKPIVSKEGIKKFGKKYWKEYLENIDIKYFTAQKE